MEETYQMLYIMRNYPELSADTSDIILTEKKSTEYVSEMIGDNWNYWNSINPVFIFTPTGSGKNNFVKDLLKKTKKNILIISNRIALNLQIKEELVETAQKIWPKFKNYGSEWMKDNTNFGGLAICNYQGINAFIEKNSMEYDYVFCDEAHFFAADSTFNLGTEAILNKIVSKFQNSIRVYMTATPEMVWSDICKVENNIFLQKKPFVYNHFIGQFVNPLAGVIQKKVVYISKQDYSYVKPFILEDENELLKAINKSGKKSKWLIFVNTIDVGTKLEIELEQKNISAAFIHSNKDKIGNDNITKTEYTLMLAKNKKFNEKVLLATSTLDNGFSFIDEELNNIVIMSFDKTTFVQMLGRKRHKNNEPVNLFLVKPMIKSISGIKKRNQEKIDIIYALENNQHQKIIDKYFNTNNDFRLAIKNGFLKIDKNGKVYYNKIAKKVICENVVFYEKILANKDDPYWANKEQLKWLGKYQDGDSVEQYRFGAPQEKLIKFIDSYLYRVILGNETLAYISKAKKNGEKLSEYGEFIWDFRGLYNAAFGKNEKSPDRLYSVKSINDAFTEHKLPYVIEQQDSCTIIKKTKNEDNIETEEERK